MNNFQGAQQTQFKMHGDLACQSPDAPAANRANKATHIDIALVILPTQHPALSGWPHTHF